MPPEAHKIERRTFDVMSLTIEERADALGERIIGHAAVFNVVGEGGWFREQIKPGAFANSIQADDIRALFNHDANMVLGRNRAGTLKLNEDERGLLVEILPPDTQIARDLRLSIQRGDITQMSFGFETIKDSWEYAQDGGQDLRTLEEVKLWDVSPVTFPFYTQTDVAVRSHAEWVKTKAGFPSVMRLQLLRREFNMRRVKWTGSK